MSLRIVPVLDLLSGVVVRGLAGRRSEYRPLVSRLTASCRPEDVAAALHAHFGFAELYLADLDAIAGGDVAQSIVAALHDHGYRLWLDAGVVDEAHARIVAHLNVERMVVGLETVASPEVVKCIVGDFGELVVFSLDMKAGALLGHTERWRSTDAFEVAAQAIERGVRRVLVLDLARVGVGEGTGTEELCSRLAAAFPHVELSAGGGVRGADDLHRLRHSGVQNVLVASALHDGRLTAHDVRGL
jgi:phosphoribosylformimino-5-aminoimidazole carboxamide ribotide isomerase